jgi:outer membrane receptor protein involved in Fe transport
VLSGAAFNGGTAVTPGTPLAFSYTTGGVLQNIKGKELPGAPNFKWNIGAQYTVPLGGGMKLSPRVDVIYVGDSYGNIFNGNVNRLKGYEQINAQIQLSGDQDKWFLRGFVQNLTDNSALTGITVGDQSQGLMTNSFALEPRRYGIAAGFKF